MQILKPLIDKHNSLGQDCHDGIVLLHRHAQRYGVVILAFLNPIKFAIKINYRAVFKP